MLLVYEENSVLKISLSETPSEENLTNRDKGSVFNRLAGFLFLAGMAVCTLYIGTQCIASSVYIMNVFEQITTKSKSPVLNRLAGFFFAAAMVVFVTLIGVTSAKAQNAIIGSVPSGPASDQVLRLSLRDEINMALLYNLGAIKGEKTSRLRDKNGINREDSRIYGVGAEWTKQSAEV